MQRDTQLFQDIFNASPIGIAVETLEGQLLFVNSAFCSMLGFTEEELRHKHCVDFSPAEDAKKDWVLFQQLRSGSIDRYQLEKRYFRRDGSLIWGQLSISLLKGLPSPLVIAMVADISDKKRAEEASRTNEERLRLAQQVGCIGTFELTIANGTITWTREMDAIYGVQCGTFGQTRTAFENLIHPDDRPSVQALIEESLKNGEVTTGEWRVLWPDRSIHWVAGRWQVLMDEAGMPSRMIGVNMDITERKLAEEALRESEEKFRHVFRDAGVGIVIVSLEGRYLQANTTFCECLGYTEEELREKTVESITFADDWPSFSEKLQQVLKDGSFQWFHKRCIHKSGRIVYTESSASLIRSSDGTPRYFVGEVLDITSRKQAEAALAGMTRKLVDAQEKERARIARELHDDINQRLAMLSLDLQELLQEPAHIKERIGQLQRRVDQLSADVQVVSRDLHPSKLEYLGVVAGIRSWCKEFGDRHKMTVDFKSDVSRPLPAELGLILLRITQEALNNAMKYSGVRKAKVRLHDDSDEIYLAISDSGVGFNLEHAAQGKGLGLTSMRERVRLLNGRITIDSKPKHGTRVYVHLPLEPSVRSQPIAV